MYLSCLLLRYCTVCVRLMTKLQANPQLWLVTCKLKKTEWIKDMKEQKDTKLRIIMSVVVYIPGIRQYYQHNPGLFLQVNKSHQFELLISFTGCCACCSVVAVICVCLLVYQDYAATSTGVGSQQMSDPHERTQCVFIWSVFEFLIWTKLHQGTKVEACF